LSQRLLGVFDLSHALRTKGRDNFGSRQYVVNKSLLRGLVVEQAQPQTQRLT